MMQIGVHHPATVTYINDNDFQYQVHVSNLSFFCDERHLHCLFMDYCHVLGIRLVINTPPSYQIISTHNRNQRYAVITLPSHEEVLEACELFKDHLFMGRKLRVQPNGEHIVGRTIDATSEYHCIHIALSSSFVDESTVKPTEAMLRKFFLRFGSTIDAEVIWYSDRVESNRQEGYAIVTFQHRSSVESAIFDPIHVIDGPITLLCAKSSRGVRQIGLNGGKSSNICVSP